MKYLLMIYAVLALLSSSVWSQTPPEQGLRSTAHLPAKIDSKRLPNLVQVHANVISGGLPEDDAAFAELAAMGIKTVVSVDGAKPDVEAAKRHGLRYVHLPHGYDGIPKDRVVELAKAVRDLESPIYVHCHHGKHRSPAAAAVACVAAGLIPSSQALPVLVLAGTDESYRGLYQAAQQAYTLDPKQLDNLQVEFQATMRIPAMAEAMVALGHTHDRLRRLADADWKSPAKDPDLDPAHEALLLQEHFTELLRTEEAAQYPAEFQRVLSESEAAARKLTTSLAALHALRSEPQLREIENIRKQIAENCKACHRQFRDIPLTEKLVR
jgi:protein tyrosine phosphatase (PTP) superfamily phosphohydrolase (DUF442 family)